MAQFQVTTSKLTQEAGTLKNLNNQLNTECGSMKSIATTYLNMWEGEAKQAFVNSANKNIDLITAFINNMNKFADVLTEGASAYEAGENEAKRIAANKGQ